LHKLLDKRAEVDNLAVKFEAKRPNAHVIVRSSYNSLKSCLRDVG